MPRWLCRTAPPSKWSSRCLPRLSARSSTRPSSSSGGRPAGLRGPGVRTETAEPARASSIPLAVLQDRVPFRHPLRDQAARLAPETGLDQGGLQTRADHRLAIDALDRQLLDLSVLGRLGERPEALDELPVVEPLAAAGSPCRRARRRAAARRRGASRRPRRCGRAGAGHRAWATREWRRTGWPGPSPPAPAMSRRPAAGCAAARQRRAGRTGRRPAPRRSSRAGRCRAARGSAAPRRSRRSRPGCPRRSRSLWSRSRGARAAARPGRACVAPPRARPRTGVPSATSGRARFLPRPPAAARSGARPARCAGRREGAGPAAGRRHRW